METAKVRSSTEEQLEKLQAELNPKPRNRAERREQTKKSKRRRLNN